jgi:hypothetical protein
MKRWMRNLIIVVSTVIAAFGLMQLVPYRVSNPPESRSGTARRRARSSSLLATTVTAIRRGLRGTERWRRSRGG